MPQQLFLEVARLLRRKVEVKINTCMEIMRFTDYLEQRQMREAEEAIKVDPAMRAVRKQAGAAVAKTLQHSSVDVSDAKTDPRVKNRLLGKALARASQNPSYDGVSVKDVATTIDPDMKV